MDKGDMQKIEFLLKSKLQNTVVGRSNEIEAIKMQFDSVLEGRSAVTIIAGDIGIGKTALVRTVLSDLSRLNAVCVYGKFEQYKDKGPYIPIIQIIEQITNHMLTLPEEKLSRIRDMLTKELGRDSALITGIVPKACRIMSGSRRIKDSDYQKLKIRLGKAFQTFISIAAKELYPLIIAVDDIQWADMASWNIIQSINEPLSEHDLYMILAYRNNLEEYRTKVKAMVDKLPSEQLLLEINLGILTSQEVKVMLGQVFGGDCDNIDELARLIHRETVGNPLYIKQMLNLLLENEGIYYNPVIEKWCLDLKKAKGVNLSDTIKDIINRKIDNLSPEAKELLEIASCIGSRFSLELLQKITKDRFECLKENLEVLKRAGLIVEIFEHPGIDDAERFEFFHDRVYQSVYEHIEPCRKEQLHFDIAIELLNHPDKVYIEEHILPITAHLLKCKSVIKREGIGNRLIMDLYFAGLKAKRSAAFEHAQKLFSLAEELLGESCWKRDYDNTLKIKLELMECQFICGEYEAAKVLFKEALSKAVSEGDLADIKKRFMVLNSYTGSPDAVIDLGIQALKHLGFSINTQILSLQIAKEMLYGKLLFRSSRLESIRNAPIVTDKRVTNPLEILTIMAASANMIDEKLFALIVLKIGNLSAKYGNSLYSPLGYAAYSLILGPVMGNFKKAEELKDISLSLAELFGDDLFGTPTYFCVGSFVVHWTSSAKESLAFLQKAFDCGIRSGDYLYCGYTLIMMIEMKYLMGEPLKELEKFLQLHEKHVLAINYDVLLRSFAIFKDHINMLISSSFSFEDRLVQDEETEMLDTNESMIYYLLKTQRAYLSGNIEEAYNLAHKAIKHLDSVMGHFSQVDFVFYFLLVGLEKIKESKESSFFQVKHYQKYRKKLEKWAQTSPANHRGKYLLIEALFAGLNNEQQNAARLYDEAIEHAKTNKNLFLEALGNLLAADYFSCNRKIARVYAQDACSLFSRWGATKVAEQIGKQYGVFHDYAAWEISCTVDPVETVENGGQAAKEFLEERVRDYQKELETLTLEEAHKYFLDTICKECGANFSAILLEEGDFLKLEYVWQQGQSAVKCKEGLDPEQFENLPKKVIRYAGRTYEEVIIESKPMEGPFASDDYIKSRPGISIICIPLKYNAIFTGLIYLESRENNRFNPEIAEHIKRHSFYLVAKPALEREMGSSKVFVEDNVKEQLTERETEVLYYMAAGMTNKEIGEKLHISASTVKTHTLNLYGKLEVRSRIQAVAKAKALGLI